MLLHGYSAMALRTSLFKKREIPRSWTHFSPHHGADQKQLLSFKFSTKLYIPSILFVSLFVTGATHSAGLGYAATWLFCYGSAHKSFQKERDPKIMDSFFTTPWCGSKAVIKFQVQHSNHQNRLFVCFNAGFCFNPGWTSAGLGYAATWLFCYGFAHKSFQKERSWTHFSPHHGSDQKQL